MLAARKLNQVTEALLIEVGPSNNYSHQPCQTVLSEEAHDYLTTVLYGSIWKLFELLARRRQSLLAVEVVVANTTTSMDE